MKRTDTKPIAAFLKDIPRHDQPYQLTFASNPFLKFFSLFGSLDIRNFKGKLKIKAKSETAWYFLQSISRYYQKGIPLVSNWQKPGRDQEFSLTNLFTWGTDLLYLLEKRRVEEFSDKYPIRHVEVAQAIINLISTMLGVELCNFINLSFGHLDNHETAVLKIDPATSPVFIKSGEDREFYIRAGNTSRALNIEEVYRYIQLHW